MFNYMLIFAALLSGMSGKAQQEAQWRFAAVKAGDNRYALHMTVRVAKPWHIYSQNMKAGGPAPTQIRLTTNPLITLEGKTVEKGEPVTKYEPAFDLDVVYYEDSVDFVQTVRLKNKVKVNVTGQIHYMICNEERCLPPANLSFEIPVGD